MKSMTGFGIAEFKDDRFHISVEIKSYNNRYLDINIGAPYYISSLEPNIKKIVSDRVARGKVDIRINILNLTEGINIYLDERNIGSYIEILERIMTIGGLQEKIRLSHLLRMEGIIKTESNRDIESLWRVLEPVIRDALDDFDNSRVSEGRATEEDILKNLQSIEESVSHIEGYAPGLEKKIRESLEDKINDVVAGKVDIDESRLLTEIGLLLAKFDINEELMRMKAHLSHFRKIVEREAIVGKKLDFICQELNREINTIGSKNTLVEVDELVISVKDSLEKIREQVRNVE